MKLVKQKMNIKRNENKTHFLSTLRKMANGAKFEFKEDFYLNEIESLSIIDKLRLSSKHNEVYKIKTEKETFLVKKFLDNRARHEYNALNKAYEKGVRVPKPLILVDNKVLVTEFIEGINLCDQLNRTLNSKYSDMLAEWFSSLHSSFKKKNETLVKSESILRNFIEAQDNVVGVDFEFSHYGNPIKDIGEICASILDTNPMFTEDKYSLCRRLIQRYEKKMGVIILKEVVLWTVKALEKTMTQRPNQKKILSEKAYELKTGRKSLV
ncbi:hypothetical protein KAX03_01495 [Candidatus Bathyarchaeota archaeon]|nr:hypothetical protein [Candidatus Bathyarchaeota archaeon]